MIYLLEDDDSIRELIVYTLSNTGFEARGFERPSAFWKALADETPSLILLDIMLPEEDGLEVLKKLRSSPQTRLLPIAMLTAKGGEYDRVIGLDLGADDYIVKPFGMMELIARVKALLRRTKEECEEYSLGSLYVNASSRTVTANGKPVFLTYKEFELLAFFCANPDVVFSRDQLLNRIWGYSFDGESRTVDVHIRTLRSKLRECGDYIETIRGAGYKLRKNL